MKHKDKDREQKEHGISMLWGFKTLNKYGAPEGDEKEQEREDRNNTWRNNSWKFFPKFVENDKPTDPRKSVNPQAQEMWRNWDQHSS